MTPLTELMLFYAADSTILKNKLLFKKKYIVLCDRYIHSTYAYQHHEQKIDKKLINFLQNTIKEKFISRYNFFNRFANGFGKKKGLN